MTQISTITAGIDTSKHKLDIALHGGSKLWQVENTPPGWRRLAAELIKLGVTRVGIEASGGYEKGVVQYLRDMGLTVLVLQPIQVRAYARAHLRRAKNDRLDAILIAECTAHLIDKHIIEALQVHPDLAKRFDLIISVPGIGKRTALALIVRMPELGQISREEAAALAGLAPYDDQSGAHSGPRHIAGGRDRLRRSLYAAALPAAFRWNRALIDLYKRLLAKGRSHKAALIACARKLLVYANTVVARGTPWLKTSPTI
jgi:transposase